MKQQLSIFLVITLCSCSNKLIPTTTDYDDNIHQQLWSADWSPDGKLIAVGGVDSLVRIYHAGNLKLYKSFPINSWIHVVKWHPDNKILAIATLDKYVLLLDPETGSIVRLQNEGGSRAMDWNFNGSLLAVGDLEGEIIIWNKDGDLVKTIQHSYTHDQYGTGFLSLDWHPKENRFMATNFQMNLFDSTGTLLKTIEHTNPAAIILCTAWHPSGEFFAIGDYGHNWEGENVPSLIHFWTPEGQLLNTIKGSNGEYRNMVWNKDGTQLATASDVLRIWSSDGSLLHQSKPDGINYLWGIDWSDIDKRIVTSSRFKTVTLWNWDARVLKSI